LGLEIRADIVNHAVQRINGISDETGQPADKRQKTTASTCPPDDKDAPAAASRRNLHYLTCNFAASAQQVFESLPAGVVRMVSFQFPDPWRRGKHKKRLIIQPKLVFTLAKYMTEGSLIYLSSDCDDVMALMVSVFVNASVVPMDADGDTMEGECSTAESRPCHGFFEMISYEQLTNETDSGRRTDRGAVIVSGADGVSPPPPAITSLAAAPSLTVAPEQELTQQQREQLARQRQQLQLQQILDTYNHCWLPMNPLDEPSERELVCEVDWRRVWRCLLRRTDKL
jgi:hypothetical protein